MLSLLIKYKVLVFVMEVLLYIYYTECKEWTLIKDADGLVCLKGHTVVYLEHGLIWTPSGLF